MFYGKGFKEVRRNRAYSQMEIANTLLSQSAYSKFEAGTKGIDAAIYLQLLDRLNVSVEEFDYICKGYQFGRKQYLIHQLFSMNYNHMEKLQSVKQQTIDFLDKEYDKDIKEVYRICEAFILLHQTQDMEVAKSIVEPIWTRIAGYEQWYLHDIRIINAILFLFPIDVAIEFTHTVLARLDTYQDFRDVAKLKTAFKVNLSLLLIKNKEYGAALGILIDSLQSDKKSMNYAILALHFSREAICRENLLGEQSVEPLEKARQLLLFYDDQDYWERIHQEFIHYTS